MRHSTPSTVCRLVSDSRQHSGRRVFLVRSGSFEHDFGAFASPYCQAEPAAVEDVALGHKFHLSPIHDRGEMSRKFKAEYAK